MVEKNLSAENILILRRGEQHRIYWEERTAVCPAKRQEAESLFLTHRHMIEHAGCKLCALAASAFVEGIIDAHRSSEGIGFQNCSMTLTASRVVKCSQFTWESVRKR